MKASVPSPREVLMSGVDLVHNTLISNLQRLEDYLQRQLDDDVEMTDCSSFAAAKKEEETRPPLNFDEDSQDDEDDVGDMLAMKFDKRGGRHGERSSSDDSVPQSPPSQAQEESKKEGPEKVSTIENDTVHWLT